MLISSCPLRETTRLDSRMPGVLGIVFNWAALGQRVVEQVPLGASERRTTRACVVDQDGLVLADTSDRTGKQRPDFPERAPLLRAARGAVAAHLDRAKVVVAQAASPGFQTYRTGWHGLLVRQVDP